MTESVTKKKKKVIAIKEWIVRSIAESLKTQQNVNLQTLLRNDLVF